MIFMALSVKNLALSFALLVISVLGSVYFLQMQGIRNIGETVCTQEVKQCLDGSYVGRTGGNCGFTHCPETKPSNLKGSLNFASNIQNLTPVDSKACNFPSSPDSGYKSVDEKDLVENSQKLFNSIAVYYTQTPDLKKVCLYSREIRDNRDRFILGFGYKLSNVYQKFLRYNIPFPLRFGVLPRNSVVYAIIDPDNKGFSLTKRNLLSNIEENFFNYKDNNGHKDDEGIIKIGMQSIKDYFIVTASFENDLKKFYSLNGNSEEIFSGTDKKTFIFKISDEKISFVKDFVLNTDYDPKAITVENDNIYFEFTAFDGPSYIERYSLKTNDHFALFDLRKDGFNSYLSEVSSSALSPDKRHFIFSALAVDSQNKTISSPKSIVGIVDFQAGKYIPTKLITYDCKDEQDALEYCFRDLYWISNEQFIVTKIKQLAYYLVDVDGSYRKISPGGRATLSEKDEENRLKGIRAHYEFSNFEHTSVVVGWLNNPY